MKLKRRVDFDIDNDLDLIHATAEGSIMSMAFHRPPGDNDFVRIYFIEPPDLPLAVFDKVPYDLYVQITLAREIIFADGSNPDLMKFAVFDGKDCLFVKSISVPAIIWAALLLSDYLVTDLGFLRDYAQERLNLLISEKEP